MKRKLDVHHQLLDQHVPVPGALMVPVGRGRALLVVQRDGSSAASGRRRGRR